LLAGALGEPVRVVRVLHPLLDVGDEFGPSISDAADAVAERWREGLALHLRTIGIEAEPSVEIVGRKESVSDTIVRLCREVQPVVVAMNSRGGGALRHLLIGSTALAVLGKVDVPVMLTGPRAETPPAASEYRIAITSDATDAAVAAVSRFASMFAGTAVQASLLGVYSPAFGDDDPMQEMGDARSHLEKLRDRFSADTHLRTEVVNAEGYESTAHAIVRGAAGIGASAIGMATHGHSMIRHLVAGSTAMGVLKQSPLPVLLVPAD
jgi:nucleotide-binding universal stress UspA family protein